MAITQGHNANAPDNQIPIEAKPDGSMSTNYSGAIVGADGAVKTIALDLKDAGASDNDKERYDSAEGLKGFRILPAAGGATSLTHIAFGWSTVQSQLSSINSAMAALITELTTPAGTEFSNLGLIIPTQAGVWTAHGMWYGDNDWIFWDGTTTIKSVAMRSVGAALTGCLFQYIE